MKKLPVKAYLIILLCLLSSVRSLSQTKIDITGKVTDSVEKLTLSNASVSLLRSKDSILVYSIRTDKDGIFRFKGIQSGSYIVLVSYPQYADWIDKIVIDKTQELAPVFLNTRAHILKEVVVKNTVAAIRVKGDTTEYKADSFRVGPNADVQELLKRLPGIQVNSKGEIKAQGEQVNKVLVDGEEFFSDDPAVVTKNLRADVVDKVQVFDKKSDQATFTGIDDGVKTKTINLQLKEDKKNGYFGKAEIGNDFKQYSNGKLMANFFKGKKKLAGYISSDNSTYEPINWNEKQNYADVGGLTTEMDDDGGVMVYISGGDDYESNTGLPTQQGAGIVFSNKWNNRSTNNNIQYKRLQTNSLGTDYTKTLLADSAIINNTQNNQIKDRRKISGNTINQWGTDSTGLIKLNLNLSNTNGTIATNYSGITSGEKGNKINQTNRNTTSKENENALIGSLSYRKKFAKKGRSISIATAWRINNKIQDGTLEAENNFFNYAGNLIKSDSINQLKEGKSNIASSNTDITYTEPVSEKNYVILKYGLILSKNDAKQYSYDLFKPKQNASLQYDPSQLVDSLSNHFIYNTINNAASLNFRHADKKLSYVIGSGIGTAQYSLKDQRYGANRNISFINFLPSAELTYSPKQQRRLRFNYSGSTVNPTLQQIQPLINNIDPLNITIGNQNLQQGFENRMNLYGSDYKVLKSRYINFRLNFSNKINDITTSSTIDAFGRRVSQYVNVNGNYSFGGGVGLGKELFKNLNVGFSLDKNFNRFINYLNGEKNTNDNNSTSYAININHFGEGILNFYTRFGASNRKTVSSIRPEVQTNYWSYETYGSLELKFKKVKTYINMDLDATLYQKSAAFPNQRNVYIFSPSIKKTFGKTDAIECKVYAYDLLNQNAFVDRNISSNFISETTNNGIRRFIMFSLVYNFSKNGKPASFW